MLSAGVHKIKLFHLSADWILQRYCTEQVIKCCELPADPALQDGTVPALAAAQHLPGPEVARIDVHKTAPRIVPHPKAVHGDVQALLKAGIIMKTETGQIVFPYVALHVDFILKAALGSATGCETPSSPAAAQAI